MEYKSGKLEIGLEKLELVQIWNTCNTSGTSGIGLHLECSFVAGISLPVMNEMCQFQYDKVSNYQDPQQTQNQGGHAGIDTRPSYLFP